jgi:hypothetical protein
VNRGTEEVYIYKACRDVNGSDRIESDITLSISFTYFSCGFGLKRIMRIRIRIISDYGYGADTERAHIESGYLNKYTYKIRNMSFLM